MKQQGRAADTMRSWYGHRLWVHVRAVTTCLQAAILHCGAVITAWILAVPRMAWTTRFGAVQTRKWAMFATSHARHRGAAQSWAGLAQRAVWITSVARSVLAVRTRTSQVLRRFVSAWGPGCVQRMRLAVRNLRVQGVASTTSWCGRRRKELACLTGGQHRVMSRQEQRECLKALQHLAEQ